MKEGNVLFNDALNTFHLRLYGVDYMVNRLPPVNEVLFPISSKGYFSCTILQTG